MKLKQIPVEVTDMDNDGWIKLHRKLLSNPIMQKNGYGIVWIYLLLSVSYKTTHFIWNNKKMTLKPGQGIISQKTMAADLKFSRAKIYRILNYLKSETEIETVNMTKYTMITITNWVLYQKSETKSETVVKPWRNRSETVAGTFKKNKNVKNVKNEKNIYIHLDQLIKNREELSPRLKELYPNKDIDKAFDVYIESNRIKDYHYKNHYLALCRWIRENKNGQFTLKQTYSQADVYHYPTIT